MLEYSVGKLQSLMLRANQLKILYLVIKEIKEYMLYFFPQNSGVLDLKLEFKESIIKGECIFHVCGYYYELSLGRHHEDIKGKNKIEDGLANP